MENLLDVAVQGSHASIAACGVTSCRAARRRYWIVKTIEIIPLSRANRR
jgi:hypothetical protein